MDTRATIEIEIKNAAQNVQGPRKNPYGSFGTMDNWKQAQYGDAANNWYASIQDDAKKDTINSRINKVRQELYHQERYKVDEDYRKEHDDREAKKEESKTRQSAYRVMIGGYASGFSSIGRVAGGFVGGGPIGAAIAAANVIGEKIAGGINTGANVWGSSLSFDGMKQMQGLHESVSSLYRNIPVLGQSIAAVYDSFFKLTGVIDTAAQRLSEYSGDLAYAQAQVEVRRIFREIERARTLGPQLANYVMARENLSEKIEELFVRFAPPLITAVTEILGLFETNIDLIVSVFHFFDEISQPAREAFNQLFNSLMQFLGQQNNNDQPDGNIDLVNLIFQSAGQLPVHRPQPNPGAAAPLGGGAAAFGAPNVP